MDKFNLTTEKYLKSLGIDLVIQNVVEPAGPLECPVCGFFLRDAQDLNSMQNHECCHECETEWYFSNIDKWKTGWRPTRAAVLKKL